jgi:hypothetical protein
MTKGGYRLDQTHLEISAKVVEYYASTDDDYASLLGKIRWVRWFKREKREVRTVARTFLISDTTHFHLRAELDAWGGESRIFSRSWNEHIPRDLV